MSKVQLQNIPIDNYEWSTRVINCLTNWGHFKTFADLDNATDLELLRIPDFGRRSLREVRVAIEGILEDEPEGRFTTETERMWAWVCDHSTLVRALMNGEAVIVPKANL